jgi:hypothetical protein
VADVALALNRTGVVFRKCDVAGHKRIYGHLVPSAAARAIAVLDEEYAEWSNPEKKK